jgi:hypothetical protein
VYVRPFSGGPAVQVSEHGTMDQIRWDRRGLVFLQARPFTVIEAPTDAHGRLTSRPPTPRLDVKVDFLTFAPPGAELLGMKGTQATELQPPPVELSVVLNWLPELRTRDTGNR